MPTIDDQDATLALTRELIARRSVTPDDAGCQDSMMARLEQVGFSVEPMRFGEVDNFWATRGTSGPLLVFAGHTDVVPPGDDARWDSDPFTATVDGEDLVGRGAADATFRSNKAVRAVRDCLAEDLHNLRGLKRGVNGQELKHGRRTRLVPPVP